MQDISLKFLFSIVYDQKVKASLYAAAGITELWVVNLIEQYLEIYRQPATNGYQDIQYLRKGEKITSLGFADISLTVDKLLG